MSKSSTTLHTRRYLIDAVVGFSLFVLITIMVAGSDTFAATLALANPDNTSIAMATASGSEHSIVVLGIVFAVLFAFNAAFFRHLGRAYTGGARVRVSNRMRGR